MSSDHELARVYRLGVSDRKLLRAALWVTLHRIDVHAHTHDADELRHVCDVLDVQGEINRRFPRGVSSETLAAAMPELSQVRWSAVGEAREALRHVNPFNMGRRPPDVSSTECPGPGTDYADQGPNPEDAIAIPCDVCGRYHQRKVVTP